MADQPDPDHQRLLHDGELLASVLPPAPPVERGAGQDGVWLQVCRGGPGGV